LVAFEADEYDERTRSGWSVLVPSSLHLAAGLEWAGRMSEPMTAEPVTAEEIARYVVAEAVWAPNRGGSWQAGSRSASPCGSSVTFPRRACCQTRASRSWWRR
ncbi:MAG: hypothetical protein ACRDNZ_00395, partial [Streptosporangiaceae bacterium]